MNSFGMGGILLGLKLLHKEIQSGRENINVKNVGLLLLGPILKLEI